jgi:para-aminobenzoate synthetase component 1
VDGPCARFGPRLFTGLLDLTSDLAALDSAGLWAVVLPFSGPPWCARFASSRSLAATPPAPLPGPRLGPWSSSLSESEFADGVAYIREAIADGDVYQVNLTRRLSAAVSPGAASSSGLWPLFTRLPVQSAYLSLPGLEVASASPEWFLRRDGLDVESRPIKGTAAGSDAFLPKDRAENVMIVDLVRNDLGRVCEYGSITVPGLCSVEPGPGLFHMVSTVRGVLRSSVGWPELVDAAFPPGSVVGAPKQAALDVIAKLEPVERGVYCGALGWVDADRGRGELRVAIRTFWREGGSGQVHLGTGGGITWDSTAAGEWAETELKAARLLSAA